MRVLICGFSVTEQSDGYAQIAATKLREQGHEVDVRGVGGIHPIDLVYLFDAIIPAHDFDVVIFELVTSGYRLPDAGPEYYRWQIGVLLGKVAARGAVPVFFNLFRQGIDPWTDPLICACDEMAKAFRVPVLDLAKRTASDGTTDGYIRDYTHTNPAGAQFYAERLVAELPSLIESAAPLTGALIPLGGAFRAEAFTAVAEGRAAVPFMRGGVRIEAVELPEGESITVPLAPEDFAAGFSVLFGPRTGYVRVEAGSDELETLCYDEYSYYTRLGSRTLADLQGKAVTFTQLDRDWRVPLRKGEPDERPRVGNLCHAYLGTMSRSAAIAEVERLLIDTQADAGA